MRKRARKDANHPEIVAALTAAHCSVIDLAQLGDGCPDLLAANRIKGNVLLEVKVGKGKLRPAQIEFRETWHGPVFTVRSVDDALRAMGISV